MNKMVFSLLLLIFSSSLFADARLIAVTGEAEIEVVPDIIRMNVEISKSSKDNAAKAKAEVDALASNVASALIQLGLSEKDIGSSSLMMEKDYDYRNDRRVFVGYVFDRDIEVVVRDVSKYSKVVQALVNEGITEIKYVQSDISDRNALEKKALAAASEKAKEKASFLAKQFGARLGKTYTIGKQRVDSEGITLEEIVVTAQKRTSAETVLYEFNPAPIKVESSIYVEFELE
ncbi:MAG: SIMPL domain-containing protein [Cellvibrionaceae bacterium]